MTSGDPGNFLTHLDHMRDLHAAALVAVVTPNSTVTR